MRLEELESMAPTHAVVGSTLRPLRRTLEPMQALSPRIRASELRHLRAPVPLRFPESEEMPEGRAHLRLRTFLFELLRYALGPEHNVGSDQFVYWDATNPRRCLSPDVFVKVGACDADFGSWKCWERGAPELAVEIISPNEGDGIAWDDKLARYAHAGIAELVRFDPEMPEGERLRAWDRIDGDFVEREVASDETPCVTLGLFWVVRTVDILPAGLRLADAKGNLVASQAEAEAAAKEAERAARVAAEAVAASAQARIRELEEELLRRR